MVLNNLVHNFGPRLPVLLRSFWPHLCVSSTQILIFLLILVSLDKNYTNSNSWS